ATADGFVDAGSGQALGFGADAGDSDTFYALAAASDEPIPLRVRSTAGRITRVDPTSASDLWTVDLGQEAATALAFTAEMVFAQPSDGSSAVGVRAIDLVDGTVVWEADAGRIVGNSAGYWSTFASDVVLAHRTGRKGDLVALDTVNGQELFGIACADDCEFGAQSREVIYLSEGWPDGSGRIRAVSLVDGSELWTAEVELPQIYDWTPKVEFTATHLWLKSAGQVGVGTHEVMQRIV
ncbi:MAG: PQQ-like beta-propeller repeat protein, partial [Bifidobacteriaceae bacterium]|nr:PQQ-like beta-propeller repeat protein [Bifidobacteriaceae bacterium]